MYGPLKCLSMYGPPLLLDLSKIKKNIHIQTKKDLDKNGLVYMYQSGLCVNVSMTFERDE